MKWRTVNDNGRTVHVVVLSEGDEAVAALTALIREERVEAAQLSAVGAFQRATVGWFDRQARDYRRIEVDDQCEVLALTGDVALGPDGEPTLHAHVVLGLSDGSTRGGHLLEGQVWPTLEVVLDEPSTVLRKTHRPEIGLALIDLDE